MKVLSRILISVLFIAFFASLGATVKDDVLLVPMTTVAPEIDGELDNVWYSVTKTPLDVWVDDIEPDEDWIDCYAAFYFMYDADNLYIFGDVMDNSIETDSPNDYENDGFEIYFDCANLKNDTYVADNDYQWRWVYGVNPSPAGPAGGTDEFAWMETDYGIAFEVAIPTGELAALDFEDGNEFGFEVQYNERDAATRQTMAKWWSNSNDSWLNPGLFGTAMFCEKQAGDPLIVPAMPEAPEIDGEADDVWGDIPTVSMAVFVDEGSLDLNDLDGPMDIRTNFKVAYDADAIYILGMVEDDEINTSSPNDYENDGFEIYFDCANLKNDTYVADNDYQWRWVYGVNPSPAGPAGATDEFAWMETDNGYQLELMIPTGELAALDFEEGNEFGFEVQVNERDGETRENMTKWWNNSNDSWLNPSLFGTAVFGPTGIEDGSAIAEQFQLSQNYPNPFNPTTEIAYSVDAMTNVKMTVYDVMGHEVATLVNEVQAPNEYRVTFDATGLTSGVYFYKLETGSNVITKKMILMK
jgi:uncharacterized protein YciU (UPF0263 family)